MSRSPSTAVCMPLVLNALLLVAIGFQATSTCPLLFAVGSTLNGVRPRNMPPHASQTPWLPMFCPTTPPAYCQSKANRQNRFPARTNALVELGNARATLNSRGPVAQWITRLTTDQKIPGSNPGRFGLLFASPSLSASPVVVVRPAYSRNN